MDRHAHLLLDGLNRIGVAGLVAAPTKRWSTMTAAGRSRSSVSQRASVIRIPVAASRAGQQPAGWCRDGSDQRSHLVGIQQLVGPGPDARFDRGQPRSGLVTGRERPAALPTGRVGPACLPAHPDAPPRRRRAALPRRVQVPNVSHAVPWSRTGERFARAWYVLRRRSAHDGEDALRLVAAQRTGARIRLAGAQVQGGDGFLTVRLRTQADVTPSSSASWSAVSSEVSIRFAVPSETTGSRRECTEVGRTPRTARRRGRRRSGSARAAEVVYRGSPADETRVLPLRPIITPALVGFYACRSLPTD